MSAMDITQEMDETTLRRSRRRRSLEKSTAFDTAMSGAIPRSKSPSRTSPERTSRSRYPIRRSPKQPIIGSSRLNLFGCAFQKQNRQMLSQNASKPISAEAINLAANKGILRQSGMSADLPDAIKPTTWTPPTGTFPQPDMNKRELGLFGQPSSPISHWPPHTSLQIQPSSPVNGFFGQPITSKSPPLTFSHSPFQSGTLFGYPNNVPMSRGLFGTPLPRGPRKLVLPSFIDQLDEEIGSWNPEYQVSPPSPPPGILNMPYNATGEEDIPVALDSRYDSDWEERLFDPVPGTGIYLGELRDPELTSKYQNVVYASLGVDGEVEVIARPYNRTSKKVPLQMEGKVDFNDIEFRACFGGQWINAGDMAGVKRCAKGRLDRKMELDLKKEKRFEEDVKSFWRNKKFGAALE